MLQILLWIFLNTFFCAALIADQDTSSPPDEPFVSSLVKTQNLLSTLVDSVSTISGEWFHSETDFIVLGPEPLILNRNYSGDHAYSDRLGYNWDFNRPHKLLIDVKEKGQHHATVRARLNQSSGIATIHETEAYHKEFQEVMTLPLSRTQGLTNCRSEISARTNLHNTMIHFDFATKQCSAITGSGHLTYYKFIRQQNFTEWREGKIGAGYYKTHVVDHYTPLYERKPSGNTIQYIKGMIFTADASENQIFGTLNFYRESAETLKVIASDGKMATYKFLPYEHMTYETARLQHFQRNPFYLMEAIFSHKPPETYEYTEIPPIFQTEHPKNPLLKAKRKPKGRFQEVEYYEKGHNELDMGLEKRKISLDKHDFRIHRVKLVKAPVGFDETPIITHRFLYEADRPNVKKGDPCFSGKTKAYDAYLRKTVYHYNNEHRLTSIGRYGKSKQLYSAECYVWDDHHLVVPVGIERTFQPLSDTTLSSMARSIVLPPAEKARIDEFIKTAFKTKVIKLGRKGNLIGKYVKDAQSNILYARYFDYDSSGNIIVDRLYGCLTGQSSPPIHLDFREDPEKNGCEYYERRFTYSPDLFHHLKSEEEDNGKGILYEYYPDRDLIAAKYVTDHGAIKLRQFFHYDENATLIKWIKDDGCQKEEDHLEGVTERHITYITPTREAPLGLPEWIEHKYVDDLEKQTEQSLKKTHYQYSKEGYRLQQDTYDAAEKFCYSLFWEYDTHGNTTKEINALGHEVIKEYDENDNLILEKGPRRGDSKEYTYDYANRLTQVTYQEDGNSWAEHYRYDLVGNKIASSDRYGNETNFQYDDFNRLIKTTYPAIEGQKQCPSKEIEYDCLDRPEKETDGRGHVTRKAYNARGNITEILHPDGQLEKFEYYLDGTLAKKTASNGTTTDFTYDCFGRLLTEKGCSKEGIPLYEISNAYNSLHKISSTDATGLTTFYSYDRAGRLSQTTCHDKIEIYEYDLLGRIAKKREPFETDQIRITSTEYDFLDRIVEERIEDQKNHLLKKSAYKYDIYGNRTHVIEETAAGPCQHAVFYNRDKRAVKTIDPLGNETHTTYKSEKNRLGQSVMQSVTTDSMGRQTIITYDAMERAVKIQKQDLQGFLLADQDLFYDRAGNLIRILDHVIVAGKETQCIETVLDYQEMGQLTLLIQANGLSEQQVTRMRYNRHGQKESIEKGDGTNLCYTYDALGRVESYSSTDHTLDYRYTYNPRHQIERVDDQIQKAASLLKYDERGRLIQEKLTNGFSISYQYDILDRMVSTTLPDESKVAYHYDALNLREVQRWQGLQLLYMHRYESFDLAGQPLRTSDIFGRMQHYQYDRQKHPIKIENCLFKQDQIEYDSMGRLKRYRTKDPIGTISTLFTYDDNDHLIQEEGAVCHQYACDSLHNRLSKNNTAHYSNGLHQLVHNGKYDYTYDRAGNLITKEKGTKICASYTYDAADRLTSVRTGEITTHYVYDAFNRRVAKTQGNQTTHYLYIGQDEIASCDEAGHVQELRILGQGHGAEIGASIAIELKNQIFAPMHDMQGNIVALTDSSGHAVESYRYTAFGEMTIYNATGETIDVSAIGNPWRFSSKRFDEESSLFYFGRRYYDPVNGCWTTADPAEKREGPNLYAYLHHRPLLFFDLYGLEEEPYYPLRDVDTRDHAEPRKEENPAAEAPLGFVEKKKTKKDRMFFCGMTQMGELGLSSINGIMNTLKEATATAKALSEMASDHFVNFVYNDSHGFVVDLVRCFFELYFHMETKAVKNQLAEWHAHFNACSIDSYLFHQCHSEGAIITRNALERMPENLRQQIIVVAYAPGAYIDKTLCHQVTHYRSTRDVVPLFDFAGAIRCRDSTVVLKPHPEAPIFDHAIDSPTYQHPQRFEVRQFIEDFGGTKCIISA